MATIDASVSFPSTRRVIVLLARTQLRRLLRVGIKSGRPALSARALMRPLLPLLLACFFAFNLYELAVHWLAGQPLGRIAVVALLRPVLITAASSAAILMIFYAFSSLIGTFTEKSDLRFLLLAPVRPWIVVAEKLLITSLGFSGPLLIAIPALYAVGTIAGFPPFYYVAVVIAILVLPVVPVSLGALVLMGVLRWIPASRAKSAAAFIGTAIGIAIYIGVQVFIRNGAGGLPTLPRWLPTTWPGRFVLDAAAGDGAAAVGDALLAVGLAAGLFLVAVGVAEGVLATGAASYGEVRRSRKQETRHVPRAVVASAHVVPGRPPWWVVMMKDLRILRRTPVMLLGLLYPLVIVGFTSFRLLGQAAQSGRSVGSGPLTGGSMGSGPLTGGTLFLSIMLSTLLVTTMAPGMVNREGRALILLALAPVSPGDVIKAKWIGSAMLPLVIVEAVVTAASLSIGLPPAHAVVLAASLLLLVLAFTGIALAANIAWPKLDATNPRRQGSATANIVGLVTEAAVGLFTGVMLFLALQVWHGAAAVFAAASLFLVLILLIAGTAVLSTMLLRRLLRNLANASV